MPDTSIVAPASMTTWAPCTATAPPSTIRPSYQKPRPSAPPGTFTVWAIPVGIEQRAVAEVDLVDADVPADVDRTAVRAQRAVDT